MVGSQQQAAGEPPNNNNQKQNHGWFPAAGCRGTTQK